MNVYEKIYKTHGLSKSQEKIIELVGKSKTVLEVGASSGYMTEAFKDNNCIVDVIEQDVKTAKKASRFARNVYATMIEDEKLPAKLGNYDFIILADVLEHLIDPEKVLKKLLKISSKQTELIISMPNIANWVIRKQLFFKGDFEYTTSGVLDKTHLHFYTTVTLPRLLISNGWKVEEMIGTITRLPLETILKYLPFLRNYLAKKFRNLSYYHFVVVASHD